MVFVTTSVYRDHDNETPEYPSSWRVQACTVDFGPDRSSLTFKRDWVYASAHSAHDDMREEALVRMRLSGYTGRDDDIVWRLLMTG